MNSEAWVEVEAPTVEEAILLGLTKLGITREQAEIEVLNEGTAGFLGLIGGQPARVRVARATKKPTVPEPERAEAPSPKAEAPPKPPAEPTTERKSVKPPLSKERTKEPKPQAKQTEKRPAPRPKQAPAPAARTETEDPERRRIESTVLDVGEHLFGDFDVAMKLTWREEDRRPALWFAISGPDAGSLVGPDGKTLNAAQFLMRVLVRSKVDGNFNLIVDAAGYRWRRYHNLKELARQKAKKALELDRPIRLRPMPARERRIVHMTLRKDDRVRTKSYGSGRGRAVTIFPKDKFSQ